MDALHSIAIVAPQAGHLAPGHLMDRLRALPWLTGTGPDAEPLLWAILALAAALAGWGFFCGRAQARARSTLAPPGPIG